MLLLLALGCVATVHVVLYLLIWGGPPGWHPTPHFSYGVGILIAFALVFMLPGCVLQVDGWLAGLPVGSLLIWQVCLMVMLGVLSKFDGGPDRLDLPKRPLDLVEDHDGFRMRLTHRSLLAKVLFAGIVLPGWPLVWVFCRVTRLVPVRTTTLRVSARSVSVETGGSVQVLPLEGLTIHETEEWEGTPSIDLVQGGRAVKIGVGCHRVDEVVWIVARLREAAAVAPTFEPVPPPPSGLTSMMR